MAEHDTPEHVSGSIGGQTFSVTTKDLIPLLLLVAFAAMVYLVWVQTDKRFDLMQAHHLKLFELHIKLTELVETNRENMRAETERLLKAMTVLQWNIRHPDDEQVPFGLNGPPGVKPPP